MPGRLRRDLVASSSDEVGTWRRVRDPKGAKIEEALGGLANEAGEESTVEEKGLHLQ